MNKIIQYVTDYQKKYLHKGVVIWTIIFLVITIFLEYTFNLKKIYSDPFYGEIWLWPIMSFHHFFPYLFVCMLIFIYKIDRDFIYKPGFWVKCFAGFVLLGLDQADFYNSFIKIYFDGYTSFFYGRVWGWLNSFFTLVIPLVLLSRVLEASSERNYYGLKFKKFNVWPYFALLLITSIFLFAGSFWPDLHEYYPRYLHSYGGSYAEEKGISEWIPLTIFELAYSSNFISVELFFRGFLIMAFSRYLGGYVVLPMVASYCFLHFGKPVGEAISSIFGGYILGIISLNTRNIWGGVIIHIGVAMLMEIFSYLQNIP